MIPIASIEEYSTQPWRMSWIAWLNLLLFLSVLALGLKVTVVGWSQFSYHAKFNLVLALVSTPSPWIVSLQDRRQLADNPQVAWNVLRTLWLGYIPLGCLFAVVKYLTA